MTKKNNNIEEIVEEVEVQEVEQSADDSQDTSEPKSFWSTVGGVFVSLGSTLARWAGRMFCGPNKELSEAAKFDVEKIESPAKMMVKAFLGRKIAMVAVIIMICMFLFVFIGPYFVDFDENYMNVTISNMSPTFSMRSYDHDLKDDFGDIDSYASFSVGVTASGDLSVWGSTNLGLSGNDIDDIPQEVMDANILFAAAGYDHCIAIGDDGTVYGWGNDTLSQWGDDSGWPTEPIDIDNVVTVECGYQASAILYKDGTMDIWGNNKNYTNMYRSWFMNAEGIVNIHFMSSQIVLVLEDNTLLCTSTSMFNSVDGDIELNANDYINGRKILDVSTTSNAVIILVENEDNTTELFTSGSAVYNETSIPELAEGEYFTSIDTGERFVAGVTNYNILYAWGDNYYGQTDVPTKYNGEEGLDIILGASQGYIILDGGVVDSWGLRGFLFGTDEYGRDVFARVVWGGKMTMTIGAVAVIVSTLIAIIVGCLAGYFGGWVDLLLMRVAEIFGSLPFLPFAMLLSAVLATSSLSEEMRIFMIMIILGLLSWTGLAQIIRGQILAEREKEFVTAAKAMGVKEGRIAFKHILPNIMSVILVSVTLSFATCMLTESSLSYLGFGVSAPTPTWGNMLTGSNNSLVIRTYWWRWVFPAVFLSIATISINIIGDTLRDVFDPRSSAER